MKRSMALALGVLALASVRPASADTIWDSGFNWPVIFNGALSNLGYISGVAQPIDLEQRWWAEPFSVPPGGCTINEVTLNYFNTRGRQPAEVKYVIFNRTNFDAPTAADIVASGSLGPNTSFGVGDPPDPGPGGNDPRTPYAEDWHFVFSGLNIALSGGDYYFTVYGDGTLAGPGIPESSAPYIAWFTGAQGQLESQEMDFGWRSTNFPNPGFLFYAPANVAPQPGQDGDDCWNVTFQLKGTGPGLRKISGNVVFNDWDGQKPNFATFEVRQAGTLNVRSFQTVTLGANGEYELNIPTRDGTTFDISLQKTLLYVDPLSIAPDVVYTNWLRRTLFSVNFAVSSHVMNFNLVNGDLDDDNEVGISDYAILSGNFGNPGPVGDINGDGECDIGDYAILSVNFGEIGDD